MEPMHAGYLAGAFDCRGSVTIFKQHAGPTESWRGGIHIDCRAASEVLAHYFGVPKESNNYTAPVLRYRTTNAEAGLTVVKGIIATMPSVARLNELLIMQHFWLAQGPEEQERVALKMRTFKATGAVPDASR